MPTATRPWVTTTQFGPAGSRVSYTANWYDTADRLTATADLGNNHAQAYTRTPAAPPRSLTQLVTTYGYDAGGSLDTVTDPRGTITKTFHDQLGRTKVQFENYTGPVGSDPFPNPDNDVNHRTDHSYDAMDRETRVETYRKENNQLVRLRTDYLYGAAGGVAMNNDLLGQVRYPDAATGLAGNDYAHTEAYDYNALGEMTVKRQQSGVRHDYTYDALGRLKEDGAQVPTSPVLDGTVTKLQYQYDALGRPTLFTSRGAGNVVRNEVSRDYNSLGQLLREAQDHSGPISDGAQFDVTYHYTLAGNDSRLTGMTYAGGPFDDVNVAFGYTGTDADIGRITSVSVNGDVVESYLYLGLNTVVERDRPQINLALRYFDLGVTDSDGGDRYHGLDRFGRVVDQAWLSTAGRPDPYLDRIQYQYDAGSNVTSRDNAYNGGAGDEDFQYDALGRVSSFARLPLQQTQAEHRQVGWAYRPDGDPHWQSFANGSWTNTHLEGDVLYDAGSTDVLRIAGDSPTRHTGQAFDAWGRLTDDTFEKAQHGAGSFSTYAYAADGHSAYGYDALGRQVTVADGGAAQDLYHGPDGRVLEDADGAYVWSPVTGDLILRHAQDLSGAVTRLYAQTDAEGSTVSLVQYERAAPQDGGVVTLATAARYLYTPFGAVEVRDGAGLVTTDPVQFAYLHGGRRYDWRTRLYHSDAGGGAFDPLAERPVVQDPSLFYAIRNAYDPGEVSDAAADPHHIAQISGWVGITALTIATGGSLGPGAFSLVNGLKFAGTAAAFGGLAGGAESWGKGEGFWSGVPGGAQSGMAAATLLGPGIAALGPATAFRVGMGFTAASTAYGVYDAEVVQGNGRLAWARLATGLVSAGFLAHSAGYRLNLDPSRATLGANKFVVRGAGFAADASSGFEGSAAANRVTATNAMAFSGRSVFTGNVATAAAADAVGVLDLSIFADHAQMRADPGLPRMGSLADKYTIAKLEADGHEPFWGMNGWGGHNRVYEQQFELLTNPQTMKHAEGDVFNQAFKARSWWNGANARLTVDRPLCMSCRRSDGVPQMSRQLGFGGLDIISP